MVDVHAAWSTVGYAHARPASERQRKKILELSSSLKPSHAMSAYGVFVVYDEYFCVILPANFRMVSSVTKRSHSYKII